MRVIKRCTMFLACVDWKQIKTDERNKCLYQTKKFSSRLKSEKIAKCWYNGGSVNIDKTTICLLVTVIERIN